MRVQASPPTMQKLRAQREAINRLAAEFGVAELRIFGSTAAGTAETGSDIDFLIKGNPEWSLLDRIAFRQALEELLGHPVDVVTERTLHPRVRERILTEAVWL